MDETSYKTVSKKDILNKASIHLFSRFSLLEAVFKLAYSVKQYSVLEKSVNKDSCFILFQNEEDILDVNQKGNFDSFITLEE